MRVPFYFAAGIIALQSCHPIPPAPPPPLDIWAGDCHAVFQQELGRPADPDGLVGCEKQMARARELHQDPAQDVFRAWLRRRQVCCA